ncbi:MAG: DUF4430 domain-containing protein [Promethearchaeota archaeon]
MKRQLFFGLFVISMLCLFFPHSINRTSSAVIPIQERLAMNIELTIDYGNSTQQVFPNLSGPTVFDVLNQTATVTFTQFPYGKFIDSINTVENNANNNRYYWQYWVNDELGPVSADNYELSDNDHVLWKYCAPETTSPITTTPDPELLLGIGIIGVLVAIVVVAASFVYFKMR